MLNNDSLSNNVKYLLVIIRIELHAVTKLIERDGQNQLLHIKTLGTLQQRTSSQDMLYKYNDVNVSVKNYYVSYFAGN